MLRFPGTAFAPAALLATPLAGCDGRAGVACAARGAAAWASPVPAESCVACVEQPPKRPATASARMSRFMRFSLVGKAPLSRKLYLRKCVRRAAGYHWRREKDRSAAADARGARAVSHHRQVDQAPLPGRRAPRRGLRRAALGAG